MVAQGLPGGSVAKSPPAQQQTQFGSLDQEDPLEEVKAAHCSILAWEIPQTEEPGRIQAMESQRVEHT